MILKDFKDFYLKQIPSIKEKVINVDTNRVKNELFLKHMLGDCKGIIDTYSSIEISQIMTGKSNSKPPINVLKDSLNNVENTIKEDTISIQNTYKEVALEAKKYISQEDNTKPIVKLLHNLFYAPADHISVAIGLKWWFLFLLLKDEITKLYEIYESELAEQTLKTEFAENLSSLKKIEDFLKEKGITISENQGRKCAEISYKHLHELRRILIDSAKGEIYISGETLGNAFSATEKGEAPIIKNLLSAVQSQKLDTINVFIMDPCVFGTQQLNEPIDTLNTSIMALINQLHLSLHHNHCKLKIHFIPFLDIDHAIITENFLLLRSTKLWTNEKNLKGSVMLYYKYGTADCGTHTEEEKENYDFGEYNAHKKFLDTISENCVLIDTTTEYKITGDLSRDKHIHYDIRNTVYRIKNNGNHSIDLYKIYSSQLNQLAVSSFLIDKSRFIFNFNNSITHRDDLFNPKNLLNDNTQKLLLPYIKKTETIFNSLIKKYDKRRESGAIIIPSLDLGYPNNIMRLAGGFATGMLIDWECGTPIIPVDSTVNVCSSSVFKIDNIDIFLKDFEDNIRNIFKKAVSKYGYSFSFDSGNHFLMIATDEDNNYYLVLHSSVKEMKETYLGLYPKEDNWYSSNIKTYNYENRYLRYIKDEDAKHFIKSAHNLEKYNVEIHKWLAKTINGNKEPIDSIIKHHYYMPTDSSIAIGTFAELPGEVVPLFSNVGKPVYLFEIGDNNWTYNLGGKKGSVCIVPHGWGQQIESIVNIVHQDKKLGYMLDNNSRVDYDIISTTRINEIIDFGQKEESQRRIRVFKDGEDFLNHGNKYISGKIIKVLTPKYLYCKQYVGKCGAEEKK